jgi:hypothetical protein
VIQSSPPQLYPALTSALEPILPVTTPSVVDPFQSVIKKKTYTTNFIQVDVLHTENVTRSHDDLPISIDKLEQTWNINYASYDTLTSRAKPTRSSQLLYCSWSVWIVDEFNEYKPRYSVGWLIVMKAKIECTL